MRFPERVTAVLRRLDETRWRYNNLHRVSAEALALLARIVQARRIVEVGTANGFSAIILGATVQDHGGRVVTIERNGELAHEATANIAAAGLGDVVTVMPGSAYKVLRTLPGPWDLAFLDATKREYVGYLDLVCPKLAPRALLTADNLLSHAGELAEFRARIAADPLIEATVLPVGMGLLVGWYDSARVVTDRRESGGEERARELAEILAPVIGEARGSRFARP